MSPKEGTPEYQEERAKLLAENRKLRQQIKSLKEMENVTEHDEKMKLVGKGAKKFEAYLASLNQKLEALQNEKM